MLDHSLDGDPMRKKKKKIYLLALFTSCCKSSTLDLEQLFLKK
jgi:hypothetical protein